MAICVSRVLLEGLQKKERLAPSVTRVANCVSRVLPDGLQKKERLLVVITCYSDHDVYKE